MKTFYNPPATLTIAVLFMFVIAFNASAQTEKPELVTDRPDQTEAPSLVPKGGLQVETGFVLEKDRHQDVTLTNYTYNTTLIKYGINEHVELRFISEYLGQKSRVSETVSKSKGMAPLAIGLKVKLADEHGIWPQAALIGHIYLNSGSPELNNNYTASDFRFTFAHTLSPKLSLAYNLGAEWNGQTPEVSFIYTLTMGYAATKKLGFFIESYSFFPERSKSDNRVDAGITWKFTPVVQWDASAGIGLSENAPDSFLSTGVSFRLFK